MVASRRLKNSSYNKKEVIVPVLLGFLYFCFKYKDDYRSLKLRAFTFFYVFRPSKDNGALLQYVI